MGALTSGNSPKDSFEVAKYCNGPLITDDSIPITKPKDAPPNIILQQGLEGHNFFAIMRHC